MSEPENRPSIKSRRPILTIVFWIFAAACFGFAAFLVLYSLYSHDNAYALLIASPVIFLSFFVGIGFTLFGLKTIGRISGNKALILYVALFLWTIALCLFLWSFFSCLNFKEDLKFGDLDSSIVTVVVVAIIGIAFAVAGLLWYRWATRYYRC